MEQSINNRPCVVITGRNYCNILTLSRALGLAGYQVIVLRIYKVKPNPLNLLNSIKADAFSKYVKSYHECIANNDVKIIIHDLKELATSKKMLLLPVDDYSTFVIDEHLDELTEHYIIPNIQNEKGKINFLMNKNEQKKLALKQNLPILHHSLIKIENGEFEIPEDILYPCFIKPNISMKSTKAIMRKCKDRQELTQVLTNIGKNNTLEILVEEFAHIKYEYSLLGLSTEEKIIAPGIFKVIHGGHRERKGVTITGEIEDPSKYEEIIEACKKYIHSLHYTGLFDVDLIETEDGRIYFVELNFRAGASIHAITYMGINLPGMLADYLTKSLPIKDYEIKEFGKRFVSEKILLEEFARSDIDLKIVRDYLENSEIHFIKDEEDIEPYKHFKKYYLISAILRIPYRIRDSLKN